MGDGQTDPGLAELVDAHRRATVRIIHLNDRSTCGSCTVPDVALAFQNEISARNRLLSWHAPSARLAIDKLCHLLSHVMAGNLEFDDESLACIRQEVARFRTSPSADHAKEGFSHLKQQCPTLIQKGWAT